MSLKRILIFIIIFNLDIFANLNNYISVQIIQFDDCIIDMEINDYHLDITPKELDKCYKDRYYLDSPKSGDFILKYYEYKFNDRLKFSFGDSDHTEGWMVINVYFNEYLIEVKDRVFWECKNCNNNYGNNNYITYDSSFTYLNINYNYWATVDPYNKIFFYNLPADSSKDKLYIYIFLIFILMK